MKLKDIKQILKNLKEELVNKENSCSHNFVVVYKKSHVVSAGYVTYGICLDCDEYVNLRDDYDYIMNESTLIDATSGDEKFEITENFYDKIDDNLLREIKEKYNEIKSNNSRDYIKSELEKVIEEYNYKNVKKGGK